MITRKRQQNDLGKNLALPDVGIAARSWDTPMIVGGEPFRVLDGDPNSYWSTPEPADYPVDLGLEFSREIEIDGLEYIGLYSPSVKTVIPTAAQQEIQYWDRQGRWQTVITQAVLDPAPPSRTPLWTHTFTPVRTTRLRLVVRDDSRTVMYIRSMRAISKDLESAPKNLIWSSAQGEPRVACASALNDGHPATYLPIVSLEAVGYEWNRPIEINGVIAQYCHFGFGEEEQIPRLNEQVVEYWNGRQWQAVNRPGLSVLDYAEQEKRAPLVHAGAVNAVFYFEPIVCAKLRLRFTGARRRASIGGLAVYHSGRMKDYVTRLRAAGTADDQAVIKGREVDLRFNFPGLVGQSYFSNKIDLVKLSQIDLHLAPIKAWNGSLTSRPGTAPEHIRDGRLDTWWSPSKRLPVEIGFEWLEPVMIGRVIVVYRAHGGKRYEPALDGHDLQYWSGRHWRSLSREAAIDESTVAQGYTTWTYAFFPTAAQRLRLVITKLDKSCSASDSVAIISIQAYEDLQRAHKDWFCSARPDPYGRWLMHGGKEPTYEDVSAHVLSPIMRFPVGFRSKESLGRIPDTAETAVSWEGTLLTPWPAGVGGGWFVRNHTNWFLGFAFGEQPKLQGIPHRAIRRSLIDGCLPGIDFTHYQNGLVYRQTVFACEVNRQGQQGKIANFIRITVANTNPIRTQTKVVAVTGCHFGYPNRPIPIACRHDRQQRRLSDPRGLLLLSYSPGGRFRDGLEKTIAYEFNLKPGESQTIELRQPGFTCRDADTEWVAKTDFNAALRHFRQNWQALLTSGAVIQTPEDRVNRAYRSALATLMLAEHGGVPVDGLWPSHYYRATWNWDECWNVMAFAKLGFAEMAKHCANTHLLADYTMHQLWSEDRLRQVMGLYSIYWFRYLANAKNGFIPFALMRIGRLVRDRNWLKQLLPTLTRCVEWTRAERAKTLSDKGPHRGLLPQVIYDGDLAGGLPNQGICYSLYPNVWNWRAMRDTGRLLKELGEQQQGERCLREAQAYRQQLLRLLRQNKFSGQKPSAFPLLAYWNYPYSISPTHDQLLLPSVLEMEILSPAEDRECADWLEENGRLMCGVQRLYTALMLQPGTAEPMKCCCTVESQYNLGYQLVHLKHDQLEQYILGFYGTMALNMDRDCFAGGEGNALCLSEEDRLLKLQDDGTRRDNNWLESNDPDSTIPTVWVLMLRDLLVFDEEDPDGGDTGVLWLNKAAPRPWFEEGKKIIVKRAPTHYGNVSYEVKSQIRKGQITAEINCSDLAGVKTIALRFRHPDKARIKKILVNGKAIKTWDADREVIRLKPNHGKMTVIARY